MREGEFAYFIDKAAEYETRGDHIVAKFGSIHFVMPVSVAQQAVARLNRALDEAHESRGNVIPLRH